MKKICGVAAPLFLACLAPGAAQQASSGDDPAADTYDETVVVTAQKREQDILEVPVAIGVIDEDTLELENRNEMSELQYLTPSVTYGDSTTILGEANLIRGLGTVTFSDGIEGSVGVVIDGVVMGRESMGLLDLSAIERIEVLRGPQGTLFGKNASAGVINVITKAPQDQFRASLGASFAENDEIKLDALVGGSLGEGWSSVLSGYSNKRDGLIEDVTQGIDYNDRDEMGARGKLALESSDSTRWQLAGDWAERDDRCCLWTTRSYASGSLLPFLQAPVVASPENLQVSLNGDTFDLQRVSGGSFQIDHQFRDVALTSITAYRTWISDTNFDSDQTPLNILDIVGVDSDQEQVSQELRLTGASDTVDWLVGAFYFDQDHDSIVDSGGQFGQPLPPGLVFLSSTDTRVDNTNAALFGDVTWAVADRISLFGGLRFQDEESELFYSRTAPGGLGFPGLSDIQFDARVSDTALSWRAGALFEVADAAQLYVKAARGYKGGGFNTLFTIFSPQVVEPEIPTSFEVGYKTRAAGGKVFFNATAFLTEIDDFQAQALNTNVAPAQFETINAGVLETQGLELEVTYQPVPRVYLSANAALIDATFDEFPGAACYVGQTEAQGCDLMTLTQDLSGAELPNSPDSTVNLVAQYTVPLGGASFEGVVRGSVHWRDDVLFALDQDPNTRQDSFTTANLAIGILDKNGLYQVTLFAKNLFDEHFVGGISDTPLYTGGYSQFPTIDGQRVVGVALDLDF